MQAKLMQQFGFQMVFTYVLAGAQHAGAGLHSADVRACADLAGPAHDALLVRIFDQAHLIEHGAQVALRTRTQSTKAHPIAQRLQPLLHARIQPRMGCKRVPKRVASV